MDTKLHLCFDLGSDTLKITYAYKTREGDFYGHICPNHSKINTAIPACALYHNDKWFYAFDIMNNDSEMYSNVVKIKSLIEMVCLGDDKTNPINSRYYYNEAYFPKFMFPNPRTPFVDFRELVNNDLCFLADVTIEELCVNFFKYIKTLLLDEITIIENNEKATNRSFSFDKDYVITLIYPSFSDKRYIKELKSVFTKAFKDLLPNGINRMLSSTRAVSLLALDKRAIKMDEDVLFIDCGEAKISYTKTKLINAKGTTGVVLDSVDVHNSPLNIGGDDLDRELVDNIEESIYNRETVGSPTAKNKGHIYEAGLDSKKYLFMKDIKNAKKILSSDDYLTKFPDGVLVGIRRDLYVIKSLTRNKFIEYTKETFEAIAQDVTKEINRSSNDKLDKIILVGGLAETYGLADFIKYKLSLVGKYIPIMTLEYGFKVEAYANCVRTYEDSVYASSLGGAIASLKSLKLYTCASLSYGTYLTNQSTQKKFFEIILDKNMVFDFENKTVVNKMPNDRFFVKEYGDKIKFGVRACLQMGVYANYLPQEYFSCPMSYDDIALGSDYIKSKLGRRSPYLMSLRNKNILLIGEPNSEDRKKLAKLIEFKTLTKDARILYKYRGKSVLAKTVNNATVSYEEGFIIDEDGHATPFIENDYTANRINGTKLTINYGNDSGYITIPAGDLELELYGVVDINTIHKD